MGIGASNSTLIPFNTLVFKLAEEDRRHFVHGDVIWGKRLNASEQAADVSNGAKESSSWSGYGSIVGFEMQELDPHNVLGGFFHTVPAQLRRWVCYEMLLGMVRSKFRNVLLTQVDGVLVVGDAVAAIRRRQSLYVSSEDRSWSDMDAEEFLESIGQEKDGRAHVNDVSQLPAKGEKMSVSPPTHTDLSFVHRRALLQEIEEEGDDSAESTDEMKDKDAKPAPVIKRKATQKIRKDAIVEGAPVRGLIQSVYGVGVWKTLEKEQREKSVVTSGFAMGRTEYVRGLANKMATEIVRIAIERKSRRPFHDKAVLNYLVHKSSVLGKRILDHLKVVPNRDSVLHSLSGSKQPHVFRRRRVGGPRYAIIQGLHTSSASLSSPNTTEEAEIIRAQKVVASVRNDICSSPGDAQVYEDCFLYDTYST